MESETGVQSVALVSLVLMREKLQQHCRNGGGSGFRIGSVPQPAAGPLRIEQHFYIPDYLGLNHVSKITACHPAGAVRKLSSSRSGGIDTKGTDYGVIRRDPGI